MGKRRVTKDESEAKLEERRQKRERQLQRKLQLERKAIREKDHKLPQFDELERRLGKIATKGGTYRLCLGKAC